MRKVKKVLSLMLVLCMVFSMMPASAFAAETAESESVETEAVLGESETQGEAEISADYTETETSPEEPETTGQQETTETLLETTEESEEETLADEAQAAAYTVEATSSARDTSDDAFYKIVHVDAGRKYFSPESIKAIIDEMSVAGYNQLELYLSDNQGFRFALDNMTITTEYGTYDLTAALGDGYSDGSKYPDYSGQYLKQAEMTDIIAYAKSKGIEIVPCINVPGHMGAILEVDEFTQFRYSGSKSSIDLENEEAVAFALAITEAYATYFESQGVKYYNLGADEYANDLSTMGFEGLYNSSGKYQYQYFVDFLNNAAQIVINHGMTPRVFNDGVCYNNDTTYAVNKAIQVCYWSSGWNGYNVASASTLESAGYDLINTHGDYYWVLGNTEWQCTAEKAAGFDINTFQGSTISDPEGAMFCIWCDVGNTDGTDGGTNVVANTADVIATFGTALPESTKETVTDNTTSVSVEASGLTAVTVTAISDNEAPAVEGAAAVVAYEITPKNDYGEYTGAGTVTLPVPNGWDSSKIKAFVVNDDDTITKDIPVTISDDMAAFTAPHFSTMGLYEEEENASEGTEERNITVSAGGSTTDTITGANYAGTYATDDESIATVTVTGKDAQESTQVFTAATSVSKNSSYYIQSSDGKYLSSTVTWVDTIEEAVQWTYVSSGNSYYLQNGSNHLRYNNGWTTTTNTRDRTKLYFNDGTLYGSRSWSMSGYTYDNPLGTPGTLTGSAATGASTTVTFYGVAPGTTSVIIGSVKYNITVTAEDLSGVTGQTVEFWITNRQVTANGSTSMTINATDNGVYSEQGALIDELVPATGTHENNTMAYWKTTRLDSSHTQTTTGGQDRTLSGTDFNYIRYWGGSWSYSVDGNTWNEVASGDQLVAYYLQVTDVTDEVTTEVVDWGVVPHTGYNSENFVLVDYTVKYESGERVPDSFPVTGKTQAFHCDPKDTNTVHQYNGGSSSTWSSNYRQLGMIRAEETADYEVYMITVTMTNDSRTTQAAGNANTVTDYSYEGDEKVVWVDDEANLGDFADESTHYTSISGAYSYSVGGEPNVPGLEIFNRHGALITYYVRAKVTEDSLSVHYVDETTNTEFYNYNIAVASGTLFNENIALANPWKASLANGSVINLQGNTQTVSADLSTMPAIGAQYRYADYTCKRVVRSDDGKTVTLYYIFDNAASFVVDFGLPLEITNKELGINVDLASPSITNGQYGTATVSGNTITYTPTTTLKGIDSLTLTLTDNGETTTRQIYIYPATTVYYEEGFASLTDFNGGSKGSGTQTTQIAGESTDEYGRDAKYAAETGMSNGTEAVGKVKGAEATFDFTGTGVDVYANCSGGTGKMTVQIKQGDSTVKLYVVDTTTDSEIYTDYSETEEYSLPVVSVTGLEYGTYTVRILQSTDTPVKFDGFRVYGTLADQGNTVYIADEEDNPTFIELRDQVLTGLNVEKGTSCDQVYEQLAASDLTSAVISSNPEYDAQSLLDNGPKNELFLLPGEAVVFKLTTNREVQVGLKAVNGSVTVSGSYGGTITSSTDMFYTVVEKGPTGEQTITITNNDSSMGILSVTKIKICDDPDAAFTELAAEDLNDALESLAMTEPSEPEVTYADATLNVVLNAADGSELASASLTANGVAGEVKTFTAEDIEAAVNDLVPDGYELQDAAYGDVEVAYGESESAVFTAVQTPVETETETETESESESESESETEPSVTPDQPTNIFQQLITVVKDIFKGLFGRG